jgi:hypothetical protein
VVAPPLQHRKCVHISLLLLPSSLSSAVGSTLLTTTGAALSVIARYECLGGRQWSREIPFGQLLRATGFGALLLLIPEVEKMDF